MVALLHHQPGAARSPEADRASLRLVPASPAPQHGPRSGARSGAAEVVPARPRLELVPGIDGPDRPSIGVIVAVALVVFGLLGAVRFVQASGAVGQSAVAADGTVVVPAPGEQIVVARPGDTLWSIAAELSPERDSRPVVAALIEANGGDSIQIGQQIVVPSDLLD